MKLKSLIVGAFAAVLAVSLCACSGGSSAGAGSSSAPAEPELKSYAGMANGDVTILLKDGTVEKTTALDIAKAIRENSAKVNAKYKDADAIACFEVEEIKSTSIGDSNSISVSSDTWSENGTTISVMFTPESEDDIVAKDIDKGELILVKAPFKEHTMSVATAAVSVSSSVLQLYKGTCANVTDGKY